MSRDFDVDEYVRAQGLRQISDMSEIESAARGVIAANAPLVERVRAGKSGAVNALVGLTMKALGGRGNARLVREAVDRLIGE